MNTASRKWLRPALIIAVAAIVLVIVLTTQSQDTAPSVSFFPVQLEKYAKEPYPSALATGVLVLDNGHLRLKPATGVGDSNLLIWPYGYSLYTEGKEIQIINGEGKAVARMGDIIKVGGGEIPIVIVGKYIGQTLPDDCIGPYWLVSEVVID